MNYRILLALLASIGAACGVVATGPSPEPPPAPSAAPPVDSSAPTASASVASVDLPYRTYQGAFLATDADRVFRERAEMKSTRTLRLRKDVEERPVDGFDELSPPRPWVVVAREEDWIRILVERNQVRMLFWANQRDFRKLPTKPTRLALKPGVYPRGPEADAQRDEIGIWVVPGWSTEPQSAKDNWIEVSFQDREIEARGWLDTSEFGYVYVPSAPDQIKTHAGVLEGTWLQAAPGGARVARVSPPSEGMASPNYWFEEVGAPVQSFHRVRYAGEFSWVVAYVPSYAYHPPQYGVGYGRGMSGRGTLERWKTRLKPGLRVETGSDLLDTPGGELCGRAHKPLDIPDRLPLRIERGFRQIEVPLGEVGYVKTWVDASKVGPIPPPPASASASASVRPPARGP